VGTKSAVPRPSQARKGKEKRASAQAKNILILFFEIKRSSNWQLASERSDDVIM
jgi:hypothetical protein